MFPSPYGVSFILMIVQNLMSWLMVIYAFPSPYGVLFILILVGMINRITASGNVSISLWSIIHSY